MSQLLKPSSTGGTTNPATGIGLHANADYAVKLWRIRGSFNNGTFESTGGGDALPFYDDSGELRGRISISGAAVSSKTLGLAAMVDPDKNPVVNVAVLFGGGLTHTYTIKVSDLSYDWDRNRRPGFMPVTLTGMLHNKAASAIETTAS